MNAFAKQLDVNWTEDELKSIKKAKVREGSIKVGKLIGLGLLVGGCAFLGAKLAIKNTDFAVDLITLNGQKIS